MDTIDILKNRRSYYNLDKNMDLDEKEIEELVSDATKLVPDAFNMKSQRLVLVEGDKHDQLWDTIYDVFGGKVAREKIDSFKKAAGTILFFYDKKTVDKMKEEYSLYKDHFEPWALQANGMLQISIWNGLEELGLGVNIQHYNPVIDDKVKEIFDIDDDYVLLAQMVYGNIVDCPNSKEEDPGHRLKIVK